VEQVLPNSDAAMNGHDAAIPSERRGYHRLNIHLPAEILAIGGELAPIRTTTRNVGAGGAYFEVPAGLLHPGSHVHVSLNVPPGEGYFPYAGRGTGVAEVIRLDPLPPDPHGNPRAGAAVRFSQPLKFVF
jgi:hypothetical protein